MCVGVCEGSYVMGCGCAVIGTSGNVLSLYVEKFIALMLINHAD